MRRAFWTLSVAFGLAVIAAPAHAQLSFGAHGAVITSVSDLTQYGGGTDINGTFGLGGRVLVSPPVFPIALVGAAEYYFMDGDATYWTAEAGVNLGLPLPIIRPYVHAGLQYRKGEGDGNSDTGFVAGLGVQLNFVISVFVEGLFEFTDVPTGAPSDLDVSPLVIKAGLIF